MQSKLSLQLPSSLERKWKSLSYVWLFAIYGLHNPWNSLGQNTAVGSLSLLQGIFPTQGLNPGFLHCRQILYQLNHKGNPTILEWVAYPFSSGSSLPRNWTGVSYIAGWFFTNWAVWEAPDPWRWLKSPISYLSFRDIWCTVDSWTLQRLGVSTYMQSKIVVSFNL